MPTGVIVNTLSVVFGGLLGGLVGSKLSGDSEIQINMTSGVRSVGMGISFIGLTKHMPAVIFVIVIGTGTGLAFHLGGWINEDGALTQRNMAKIVPNDHPSLSHEDYLATLLTIIVFFCASGTDIYGNLDAGATGDSTTLISKPISDFFTAAILVCNLDYVVSPVAIPQFIISCCLFFLSTFVVSFTTPDMIADFKACGGFLMFVTGFRMVKLKMFPTANMVSTMILIIPLSWFWVSVILPLL